MASCVTLDESFYPYSLSFPGQVGMTILLQGSSYEIVTVKPCAHGKRGALRPGLFPAVLYGLWGTNVLPIRKSFSLSL